MATFESLLPSRESCTYTAFYCEENVWHLCKQILQNEKSSHQCFCVFMSNKLRAVHLWKQKICNSEDQYVIWDYHVFALYGSQNDGYCILDLDTLLSFPVSFRNYAEEAIKSEDNILPDYKRYFRVIPAAEFLNKFSSDRRHMRVGGTWQHPPPNYPPIIADPKNPHNLDDFINMEKGKGCGEVLNCKEFVMKFSK